MLNNSTSQYMKSCRSYKRKDEITINVIIVLFIPNIALCMPNYSKSHKEQIETEMF